VHAHNESAAGTLGELASQAERWQLMHNETLQELQGQKEMVGKLMLEKVGLLNQTAAELAAKDAELLRQRLKQRSAEEALSKIDRSLAEERAEMEEAESAVLEAESQHNELAKELETKKAELQDQVGQARKELAEAKRRQMAAALYSGPGVTHPEHKEALQLQAGAASAKLLQMERELAEAKAALAQQQGTMHDSVGKVRMAEQAKAAEAAKVIEEENGKADKAAHEAVAHLYEMEDALHRAREARATLEDTHAAALLASEQQAKPPSNTLSPVEVQQSDEVKQALAESAASLQAAKLKVSKAESERDAAKKGSDAREAKLHMVREKKRAHLKKLTGLYNALSDKYEMAVHATTPKANLDVFDKTAARAVKAEQERDAAAEQVAKLKAQLREAEVASAQRDVSTEPTSANKLRLKVAEQTARADKSQEARVTLTRELASRDKTAAALVAEKSTLAAELAKQKQALTAAAVHLKKLESTSSAASEMASLQKKLDFQTDAHARAQKDKQQLSNELERQNLDLQHETDQHSKAVEMAAGLQAELAQQKAHLATEQDKLHRDGAGQAGERKALGAREAELESEARGYATAERQAAQLAEEVQKQQLELSSDKELSSKAQEEKEALSAQLETQRAELASTAKTHKAAEERVLGLVAELKARQAQLEEEASRSKAAQQEKEQLSAKLAEQQVALEKKQAELNHEKTQLHRRTRELELRRATDANLEEMHPTNLNSTDMDRKRRLLGATVEKLRAEKSELGTQLKERRAELQQLAHHATKRANATGNEAELLATIAGLSASLNATEERQRKTEEDRTQLALALEESQNSMSEVSGQHQKEFFIEKEWENDKVEDLRSRVRELKAVQRARGDEYNVTLAKMNEEKGAHGADPHARREAQREAHAAQDVQGPEGARGHAGGERREGGAAQRPRPRTRPRSRSSRCSRTSRAAPPRSTRSSSPA